MKLKMIAIAVAAMSLFGSAHADLSAPGAANGSFVLTAVNTANQNWYMRDLGFFINSFLPSNITTASGDGGVTGDKTPAAGLTLDATTTAASPNFADASFSTWLGAQTLADVKWIVTATDSTGINANDRRRLIISSANSNETFLNSNVTQFIGTPVAGGLANFFGSNTLSTTGTGIGASALNGFGFGSDALASVGQSVNLFYAFRNSTTGGNEAIAATSQKYFNATGNALVTLNANGDFSYVLAGAPVGEVPLPATVWLMGAGLAAVGGFIRRRKAALQA